MAMNLTKLSTFSVRITFWTLIFVFRLIFPPFLLNFRFKCKLTNIVVPQVNVITFQGVKEMIPRDSIHGFGGVQTVCFEQVEAMMR